MPRETIRRATADDFDRIFHLARSAFPIAASEREEMLRTFKPERNVVLEVDGRILARAIGFSTGHWFGGRAVPALGVAGVTVSPEARGRGYGTQIVRFLLDEASEKRQLPLSSLYPATVPIYRSLGYGQALHRTTFKAPLTALPSKPDPGVEIREMRDEDLPTLIATYDRFAAAHNGVLVRDGAWWAERVLTNEAPFRYLAFRDGTCVGWLLYGFERRASDWRQDLSARDFVWCDLGAAHTLLSLAALHRSTCVELRWAGPVDEPLVGTTYDHAIQLGSHFRAMLRILDVPEALRARGYPATADLEVTLRVRDPERPANEGPWRLTVAKGTAAVEAADTAAATISIQGLASIYAGLVSVRDAVRLGDLEADRDTILALEASLAGPTPWLADFY